MKQWNTLLTLAAHVARADHTIVLRAGCSEFDYREGHTKKSSGTGFYEAQWVSNDQWRHCQVEKDWINQSYDVYGSLMVMLWYPLQICDSHNLLNLSPFKHNTNKFNTYIHKISMGKKVDLYVIYTYKCEQHSRIDWLIDSLTHSSLYLRPGKS